MIPSTSSIVYSLLAQIPNQMAKQRTAPNSSVLIIGAYVWRGPDLKKPSFNSTIWSQSFSKFFGQSHIFTCSPTSPSFWYRGRASSGASLNSQHSIWVTKVQIKWDCERRPSGTSFFPFFHFFFFFCCAKTKTWPCPKNITFSLLICHEHSPICSCSLDYLCLHNRSYRSLKKLCCLGQAYVSYQSLFWFEILAPFLIHFGPVVWVIYLSLQIRFIVSCTVQLPLYFLLDIVKTQKLRGRMQIAKPGISCVMWLLFLDNLFLIIHMHIIHL